MSGENLEYDAKRGEWIDLNAAPSSDTTAMDYTKPLSDDVCECGHDYASHYRDAGSEPCAVGKCDCVDFRAAAPVAGTATGDEMDDNDVLQVLCRAFDDWEPIYEEWLSWYNPTDWLHRARGFGAFMRKTLDARNLDDEKRELLASVKARYAFISKQNDEIQRLRSRLASVEREKNESKAEYHEAMRMYIAENRRLHAENAAMREDSARLDFLNGRVHWFVQKFAFDSKYKNLREAIDAARQQEGSR